MYSSKLHRSYDKYMIRILLDLVIEEGYKVSVDNYSTIAISRSTDPVSIMVCMFSNDEECLLLRKDNSNNAKIYLRYGRDNIISHYTSSLGTIIDLVHRLTNNVDLGLDERTIVPEPLRW